MNATLFWARRALVRLVLIAVTGAAQFLSIAPAHADDSLVLFFARETPPARSSTPSRNQARFRTRSVNRSAASGTVRALIAAQVTARLGPQWVATALRIAHIESRGDCAATNRGAIGVFQVRHPERFGVSSSAARTCAGGISAGVSHMAMCLAKGARTSGQMMVCHNSGSPYSRSVERAYRFALRG